MTSAYLPQFQGSLFTAFLSSDQPYLSALHAWQACMRTDKLPATNPDDAANSMLQLAGMTSAADLTHRQTALATADAACDGPSQLRQRTNQVLDRFVSSLSPQVLAQLDDVARSRARADQTARQIVPYAAASPFGQLPVMGYNTWYQFGAGATESAVLAQADRLVSSGLATAGYDTVNLDDGWMATARAGDGSLTWNTARFPHGIPWLAGQIHALGLNFGIYEAIGTRTCQNLPGSGGSSASDNHYAQDARTFESWGVDFVKIDECGGLPTGTTLSSLTAAFQQYGADLRADNASVVYSEELPIYVLGQSDFTQAVQSSATFANLWRVAADESPLSPAATTILGHLAADLHLHAFAGSGHWNDLDMLVPGAPAAHPFGWSLADEQSQLSVWAEEASPLLISTDLTTLTAAELAALQNPDIIAIDQSGAQAATAVTSGHIEAVMKKADNGTAVLFANLGTGTGSGTFTLAQFGISTATATGYNVWRNETTTFSGVAITLAAGQTETVVLKPVG